jgi:hypothetical protein
MPTNPPYYTDEEVIGSSSKYHRSSCHIIRNIDPRNRKLLPSPQRAVELGLEPCGYCHPYSPQAVRQPSAPAPNQTQTPLVSATQLADWRRAIVQLLNAIDASKGEPQGGGVAARIRRLSKSSAIPLEIAPFMLGITEMRNAAEYKSKRLTEKESAAVKAAWTMLQEWATASGLDLDV